MQFDSIGAFFTMGGHALYLWLAYGATLLVLLVNVIVVRNARKRQLERLRWQAQSANDDLEVDDVTGSGS